MGSWHTGRHGSITPARRRPEKRTEISRPAWAYIGRLSFKKSKQEAREIALLVKCLPCKQEDLNSVLRIHDFKKPDLMMYVPELGNQMGGFLGLCS